MNKEKRKKILSKISSVLFFLLFLYTAFLIFTQYTSDKEAFFFGVKPVVMKSEVMAPLVKPYDVVIVKKVGEKEKLEEGSLLFYKENEVQKGLQILEGEEEGKVRLKKVGEEKALRFKERSDVLGRALFSVETLYPLRHPIESLVFLLIVGVLLYIGGEVKGLVKKKIRQRRKI